MGEGARAGHGLVHGMCARQGSRERLGASLLLEHEELGQDRDRLEVDGEGLRGTSGADRRAA